jgi:hypothetical protein
MDVDDDEGNNYDDNDKIGYEDQVNLDFMWLQFKTKTWLLSFFTGKNLFIPYILPSFTITRIGGALF